MHHPRDLKQQLHFIPPTHYSATTSSSSPQIYQSCQQPSSDCLTCHPYRQSHSLHLRFFTRLFPYTPSFNLRHSFHNSSLSIPHIPTYTLKFFLIRTTHKSRQSFSTHSRCRNGVFIPYFHTYSPSKSFSSSTFRSQASHRTRVFQSVSRSKLSLSLNENSPPSNQNPIGFPHPKKLVAQNIQVNPPNLLRRTFLHVLHAARAWFRVTCYHLRNRTYLIILVICLLCSSLFPTQGSTHLNNAHAAKNASRSYYYHHHHNQHIQHHQQQIPAEYLSQSSSIDSLFSSSIHSSTDSASTIILASKHSSATHVDHEQSSPVEASNQPLVATINQFKVFLQHLHVPTADTLVLLVTTVLVVPLMSRLQMSPILGFLAAGVVLGPTGFNIIRDLHATEILAEFGVVFFLFEMGLELSTAKLKALKADVFGLGSLQFFISTAILALAAILCGLPTEAAVIVGGSFALSSSAFVLQLLQESGQIGSRFGRASLGILLFQDLAVVPLVVLTPLLAGGGGSGAALARAISFAALKGILALIGIAVAGKLFLEPVFKFVSKSKSEEAFAALIFFTAIATSTLTQSLGLSETLGAFLAGVMLAETKYCHQVEAVIKPIRGLLLGLFFITIGFSIDLKLAFANIFSVAGIVIGLLVTKAAIITAIMVISGSSLSNSTRTGLLLAQGGEFAFVVLGLAQRLGILPLKTTQLFLLVTALTMALTPTLDYIGASITATAQNNKGLMNSRQDIEFSNDKDLVVVAGFGRIGRAVSQILGRELIEYVAFDPNPTTVLDAKKQGLPVFFGDARKPDFLKSMGLNRVKAFVIALDDQAATLEAVTYMKREFPKSKIFCRAIDSKDQKILSMAGADAIVSALVETSYSLGGAVLLSFGVPVDEVNTLIDEKREEAFSEFSEAAIDGGAKPSKNVYGTRLQPVTESEVIRSKRPNDPNPKPSPT